MKTINKITFILLSIMLVFTACSKRKEDIPQKVAKEITVEELADYYIIEEYTPKPENAATYGTKPVLLCTYLDEDDHITTTTDAISFVDVSIKLTYNPETGITKLETYFGDYELSRDDNEQIIVKKSIYNSVLVYPFFLEFSPSYIQLVKTTNYTYTDLIYKEISGNGFYGFSEKYWRYKHGAAPTPAEWTWMYGQHTNQIWYGRDGGTAKYDNLFLIVPKGNGWKGQHKDKDLLIVNTLDEVKVVGDIGIYTPNN